MQCDCAIDNNNNFFFKIGPEVAEQLSVYQQSLKNKKKQMRAMISELEMYKVMIAKQVKQAILLDYWIFF